MAKQDSEGQDNAELLEHQQTPLQHLMFQGHLAITIRVIGLTLSVMTIFGYGGYLLDQKFDTQPILLIVGLVIGFPVLQLLIYRTFTKMTGKLREDESVQSPESD